MNERFRGGAWSRPVLPMLALLLAAGCSGGTIEQDAAGDGDAGDAAGEALDLEQRDGREGDDGGAAEEASPETPDGEAQPDAEADAEGAAEEAAAGEEPGPDGAEDAPAEAEAAEEPPVEAEAEAVEALDTPVEPAADAPDAREDAAADGGDASDFVDDRVPYERITPDLWYWGARAAVSLTCDEEVPEPYDILMPEVEARGWRMTFFICTDCAYWLYCVPTCMPYPENTTPWAKQVLAHQRGHEVSSHTRNHPDMTTLGPAELHIEMAAAISDLHRNVDAYVEPDLELISFSYPYERWNGMVWDVVGLFHRYARSGDLGVEVPPNPVPLNDARAPAWGGLAAKAPTHWYSVAQWNSWVTAAYDQGKWFIEELHGVTDGAVSGGWEPRTIQEFRQHFDHIQSFGPNGIWVATMGTVGKYIEERETSAFRVLSWSFSRIEIEHRDAFDLPSFDVPVSSVIELPAWLGWTGIEVRQGGTPVRSEKLGAATYRFASVPDPSRPVVITPL